MSFETRSSQHLTVLEDNTPLNIEAVMKHIKILSVLWTAMLPLFVHAQEAVEEAAIRHETCIPGPIADGAPAAPVAKPEPIDFTIQSAVTHRMKVEKAPEMDGLPPVKGTINVTVQLVKDPGLPDLPPPLPALRPNDPAVVARMEELRESHSWTELVFISATVYDHSRTFLRCYFNGEKENEISGWSNLDFNHFGGFGIYQIKAADGEVRQYGLMMGLGNEDTRQRAALLEKHDRASDPLEIPKLPDLASGGPAFVVTEENVSDREAMAVIEGMHDLYQIEGERMAAAYHSRTQAYEERKAFLLANPPQPEDVTITFWKRESSSPVGVKNRHEEAKP